MNTRKRRGNNNKQRLGARTNYAIVRQRQYTTKESQAISFFDPHRYITLRYCDIFTTGNLAATTAVAQIMNLNSLFDPDRTGTGHQPMGFDQLAGIYARYRVLKVRWKVIISPSSVTYHAAVVPLNGLLASAVTTAATFTAAAEQPRAKLFTQAASGNAHTFNGFISLNALAGTTPLEYLDDDRYEALVTATPSEIETLYIALYNPNAGTIVINYSVELLFECDLHDPIAQAQS
jgi:hypothetical protein